MTVNVVLVAHGHAFTPENTRVYRTNRICRTCDRNRVLAEIEGAA